MESYKGETKASPLRSFIPIIPYLKGIYHPRYNSVVVNMLFRQMLMDEALPFQPKIKHKRQSLNEYLEAYHGKDIETILQEAEESNENSVEIDWGKPAGAEVW